MLAFFPSLLSGCRSRWQSEEREKTVGPDRWRLAYRWWEDVSKRSGMAKWNEEKRRVMGDAARQKQRILETARISDLRIMRLKNVLGRSILVSGNMGEFRLVGSSPLVPPHRPPAATWGRRHLDAWVVQTEVDSRGA